MSFSIAATIDEALEALASGARPIAGGTDLVVGHRQGKAPLPGQLVAIDRIAALQQIETTPDGTTVGAGVTHGRLETDPTIVERYTSLADSAALVGSPATRNVGTIGGNVMNGSPAMDTGAPLLVLGAQAELQSMTADGTHSSRLVPLAELWTGPGQTSATSGELCVALQLPLRPDRSGSAYVRLEYRRAMEIAVVGAAAAVTLGEDGTVVGADLALTAVAPTIIAVDGLSDVLGGRTIDDGVLAEVADLAATQSSPISDLRAGDAYRRQMVGVMARRAVDAAARRAGGEAIGVPVNRTLGIGAAR